MKEGGDLVTTLIELPSSEVASALGSHGLSADKDHEVNARALALVLA